MNKKLLLLLIAAGALLLGIVIFFQISPAGTQMLWTFSNEGKWLLPLVVTASLIDSINPCAFSVLILTVAFLLSIGRLRSNIFKIGGAYIFGIFAIYILIGLGLLQALHLFNTPHFVGKIGAALLILLGIINIVNVLLPKFPLKLKIPHASHTLIAKLIENGSLPAAFVLGALVGLCEFPCTGGPYLMVLGLLHDSSTYFHGLGYLLLYNIIFVLPLVILLGIASNKLLLEKVQNWEEREKRMFRLVSGSIMILLGIIVFLF